MSVNSAQPVVVLMTGTPLACTECATCHKACDSRPVYGDDPHVRCSLCIKKGLDCTPRYSQGHPTPSQLKAELDQAYARIAELEKKIWAYENPNLSELLASLGVSEG